MRSLSTRPLLAKVSSKVLYVEVEVMSYEAASECQEPCIPSMSAISTFAFVPVRLRKTDLD